MIPHREEETTPLSPRMSDISDESGLIHEEDYLSSSADGSSLWEDGEEEKHAGGAMAGRVRHALGITLLLATVFLWTASNFLASTIFADNSYSKPYFVTYINTTFFILPLIPMGLHHLWASRHEPSSSDQPLARRFHDLLARRAGKWSLLRDHEPTAISSTWSHVRGPKLRQGSHESTQVLLGSSRQFLSKAQNDNSDDEEDEDEDSLTIKQTAILALEFCILWFLANYFAAACLSHTTVASSTILSSTSSIWTLLLGAALHVERFTLPKLLGVAASLSGVALISLIDASGATDHNRGTFPHKSPRELALGDAMAFISAVLYGFYTVFMKKRIRSESRVNMPLFFGLVGLFNTLLLWPGLIVLHFLQIESFSLPQTSRIATIVLVNSASSLVSDFCWAYAMLLTSPLVVTVGLSLTIPLSLVGQMVLEGLYASGWYWVGAGIMVASFLCVNREGKREVGAENGGLAGVPRQSGRNAGNLDAGERVKRWWRRRGEGVFG